ncbi:ARM repeat-containing protein [Macrolepiota fuliginosa MF-IS2]|uniref:ARM repeat-containing protein n=1 Tax=Macrolepiota fuliginosa MF-IS2 TaxID=1400762 RepID=A0A9P5X2Z1_9AGAR|nr:ARM repeat-containing protein [Macrolepiota fuliginosa MF-IS2]
MVAQTRLIFKDKLTTRGLTADQILKRLQRLYDQLDNHDQDDVDRPALSNTRTELIHKTILLHKDQGVRAYTACCLAELLRLYAPDAPYTQPELRDIFQFFVRQLKDGLKTSETAYHNQYFHLLESLATVKSAVLICDLPSGDEIMLEFFTTFFYIVRRGTTNKKMEAFMGDILIAVLDECQSVPQTVLDTILAQFMDKDARREQPAYRLAVHVCNNVADKLQRPVCQYFTDIIVDSAAHDTTTAAHDSDSDNDEDKFEQLQNAHELIKRLHQSCPAILHGVLPQLAEELRVDHVNIRQLATVALGEMYADKNGGELATKYPATWDVWISRKNDKVVAIRLKFVEALKPLLAGLPIKREALAEALEAKLWDPDERVRMAACKAFTQLDYESALHNVSEELLRAVASRFLDKKASVRSEALNGLGKLYNLAYPEIENNDVAAIKHFGWIPNSILEVVSQSPLVRDMVERVWATHILPLTSPHPGSKSGEIDEVQWTEKLLNVMKHLSDKSIEILVSLSGIKEARPGLCDKYLDACVRYNGGVIDDDEEQVTQTLNVYVQTLTSWIYANDHKASEDLHTFAKMNENRLYKLLKTCFNPQSDIKTLAKSSHEFLRRVDTSSSSNSPSLPTTLSTLLYHGSLHIINHSSIPTLLKKLQLPTGAQRRASTSPSNQLAATNSTLILKAMAKWAPGLVKAHFGELVKRVLALGEFVGGDGDTAGEKEEVVEVEVVLRLLGNFVRFEKGSADGGTGGGVTEKVDRRVVERMVGYALGRERRLAKFAARFLVLAEGEGCREAAGRVVKRIVERLKDAEDIELAAHVAALVQYARYAPGMFEEYSDVIMEYLVRRVINMPVIDGTVEGEDDNAEEWYEDSADVPPLLWAKISTLKVFRHRCLNAAVAYTQAAQKDNVQDRDKGKGKETGAADGGKERAEKIVGPVVKMMQMLIVNEGAMSPDSKEDPKARSRMRLQAAVTLLHLARMDVYLALVMENFGRLVLTIQDTCYGVRSTFLNKLIVLFMSRKLPPAFSVIFFLTVHDPEEDVKTSAEACVRSLLRKLSPAQRVEYFELMFVRLLHTLAHHPDFGTEHDDLLDLAKYLKFYLGLIATSENVSLLYNLTQKGKTVRDHASFTHSENFYILCELSQDLIKVHASVHSWSIQSYPGKVRMPADILRPLPNAEAANRILKTTFLPDETREWVANSYQHQRKERKATTAATATGGGGAASDKEGGSAVVSAGGKRKASKSRGSAAKRRKGKKDKWDSDENDDDEEEEEEDVDMDGQDEEEQAEGSDVEMESVDGKGKARARGKGRARVQPKAKAKATGAKPKAKSKSKREKEEEDREAREAKGLRTSARTRAKAQEGRKKPRRNESGDEADDDSDKMDTS